MTFLATTSKFPHLTKEVWSSGAPIQGDSVAAQVLDAAGSLMAGFVAGCSGLPTLPVTGVDVSQAFENVKANTGIEQQPGTNEEPDFARAIPEDIQHVLPEGIVETEGGPGINISPGMLDVEPGSSVAWSGMKLAIGLVHELAHLDNPTPNGATSEFCDIESAACSFAAAWLCELAECAKAAGTQSTLVAACATLVGQNRLLCECGASQVDCADCPFPTVVECNPPLPVYYPSKSLVLEFKNGDLGVLQLSPISNQMLIRSVGPGGVLEEVIDFAVAYPGFQASTFDTPGLTGIERIYVAGSDAQSGEGMLLEITFDQTADPRYAIGLVVQSQEFAAPWDIATFFDSTTKFIILDTDCSVLRLRRVGGAITVLATPVEAPSLASCREVHMYTTDNTNGTQGIVLVATQDVPESYTHHSNRFQAGAVVRMYDENNDFVIDAIYE